MKALLRSWIAGGLALMMAASMAASVTTTQDRAPYRQEELDQMLAPIALYPDPLLSQILMASTYPLEVVEAARWSHANPSLKGQDAVRAVDSMNWDPSVKSLAAFPQVLAMMDSKLDWTESLGEAFMGQQEDVMNSVQGLRQKAQAQGNLLSSDQMSVGQDGGYITLAPPAPEVAYVPYYDPTVVYGPWWYPAYPPVYWAPPAYYVGPVHRPGFYWGSGIAISATFFFGHTDWRHRRVTVARNQVNNVTINRTVVNNRTVISNAPARSRVAWQPDPAHRRGAPFHVAAARQRFEQRSHATASRSAVSASPTIQQRNSAAPDRRESRQQERRAAPQANRPAIIQGGQRAQPSTQQRDTARTQAEARRRQAAPAPQAAEPRIENRQAPRPQAQPNAPRAESRAQRPTPQRSERQAERREAPRAQPQSHSPRPAAAAPRPEARNNGGGGAHHAPAANRPAARSNGNQQRTEHGPHGKDS